MCRGGDGYDPATTMRDSTSSNQPLMNRSMAADAPVDIATLVASLTDRAAATRIDAAERLCRAGAAASPAIVALVSACGDDEAEVRDWAVAALEEIGPPPAGMVHELEHLLRGGQPLVAYWAATLLGRSGQAAASAVEALTDCLTTATDSAVTQRAAWALGKIGPAAAAAVAPLRHAAAGQDPRLARLATEALAAIGG